MKKNVYFQSQFQRINVIREFLLQFFIAFGSVPALIIEVFCRKKFGERYFTLLWPIVIFLIMVLLYASNYGYSRHYASTLERFNLIWLIFALVFLFFSILRRIEIRRSIEKNKNTRAKISQMCSIVTVKFKTYSKFDGEPLPYIRFIANRLFPNLDNHKKSLRRRLLIEPGLAIVLGLFLIVIHIGLTTGIVITACGILHLGREYARYALSRNSILDIIDSNICDEDLFDVFVEDNEISDKQLNYFGPKPPNEEDRKKCLDGMVSEDSKRAVRIE